MTRGNFNLMEGLNNYYDFVLTIQRTNELFQIHFRQLVFLMPSVYLHYKRICVQDHWCARPSFFFGEVYPQTVLFIACHPSYRLLKTARYPAPFLSQFARVMKLIKAFAIHVMTPYWPERRLFAQHLFRFEWIGYIKGTGFAVHKGINPEHFVIAWMEMSTGNEFAGFATSATSLACQAPSYLRDQPDFELSSAGKQ